MNTKLHAIADANGRPLSFFMTADQVSDYTGAAALLDDTPKAQWLLGDRGYDADWFQGRPPGQRHPALHPRPQVATSRSGTTSAATGVAAASRLCSAA